MKTKLQKQLGNLFPSIGIRTFWGHDNHIHPDIRKNCDGMDDENPEDWQAWQSEIRVTVICEGEEITASEYMGGTWEKAGDVPEESNPTISGYEPQMTRDAIDELRETVVDNGTLDLLGAASLWLKEWMQADYDRQRAEIEASRAVTA